MNSYFFVAYLLRSSALYHLLYLIKNILLWVVVQFHTASDLIFLYVIVTYISCPSDFALYLLPYQTGMHHTLDSCSV